MDLLKRPYLHGGREATCDFMYVRDEKGQGSTEGEKKNGR